MLVSDHLTNVSDTDDLDVKLRERQRQDRLSLFPNRSAAELFAASDAEATLMTADEKAAEDLLWRDFQTGINETRASLGMRQL